MNYSIIELAKVWVILENMAEGRPENRGLSICQNLSARGVRRSQYLVEHLALGWSKHSGSSVFPIPGTHPLSAYSQWRQCYLHHSFWIGKQGELRQNLCRYMADKLAKRLGVEASSAAIQ